MTTPKLIEAAKQTPLADLLDQVPEDIVLGIQGDEPVFKSYTNIPIGNLAKQAAAELRRLALAEAAPTPPAEQPEENLWANSRLETAQPVSEPAWSHWESRIKTLMAQCGHPDSALQKVCKQRLSR